MRTVCLITLPRLKNGEQLLPNINSNNNNTNNLLVKPLSILKDGYVYKFIQTGIKS